MHTLIADYAENQQGRDFFVGDIHGCYQLLQQALARVAFDPSRDRLFCVGDICDRGADSLSCLQLVLDPQFPMYSVKGNHETMMIDALEEPGQVAEMIWQSPANGGSWSIGQQQLLRRMTLVINRWPLVMRVHTSAGLIVVVHADLPVDNISQLQAVLSTPSGRSHCLWSRERIQQTDVSPIKGARAVVVGHTPFDDGPVCRGNIVNLDTGAFYSERLTLLSSEQIIASVGTVPPH